MNKILQGALGGLGISLILAAVLLMSTGGEVGQSNSMDLSSAVQPDAKDVITVGAVLPMSGFFKNIGGYIQSGLVLAGEDLKNRGYFGKKKFRLVVNNESLCNKRKVAEGLGKLIFTEDALFVFGPYCSNSVSVANAVSSEQKIPLMMFNPVDIKNLKKSKYLLYHQNLPEDELKKLFEWAKKKNISMRVALVYGDTEVGHAYRAALQNILAELRGKMVVDLAVSARNKNVANLADKIFPYHPNIIIVADSDAGFMGNFVRSGGEILGDVKFFLPSFGDNSEVAISAGDQAGKIVLAHMRQFDVNKLNKKFVARFIKRFQRPPNRDAVFAFNFFKALAPILKQCGNDRECVANKMQDIKTPKQASYKFWVDEGVIKEPLEIRRVKDGVFYSE